MIKLRSTRITSLSSVINVMIDTALSVLITMKTPQVEFARSVMKTTCLLKTNSANARKKLFVVSVQMGSERSLKNVTLERMRILDALIVKFKKAISVKKLHKKRIIVFQIVGMVF